MARAGASRAGIASNSAPSGILFLGEYGGGLLFVEIRGDKNPLPVIDQRGERVEFDGRNFHYTSVVEWGIKYSVVLFSHDGIAFYF